MKRALVLSSGGSRGQYHVGAVQHLLGELETHYDIYAGVSVGALVAGFLAQYGAGEEKEASRALTALFTPLSDKQIYRPWRMGLMAAFWKPSLYDATPLRALLRRVIDVERVRQSGKELRFGATSLSTGTYTLFDQTSEPFHDLLYASAAFPVAFDPIEIEGQVWTDGGIRAVTPLRAAIKAGADAIDMILLTPEDPHPRFKPDATALEVGIRCLDIMLDEIVDNDARMAELINRLIEEGGSLPNKRHIDIRILRPAEELPVTSHVFDPVSAPSVQKRGYEDAKTICGCP